MKLFLSTNFSSTFLFIVKNLLQKVKKLSSSTFDLHILHIFNFFFQECIA